MAPILRKFAEELKNYFNIALGDFYMSSAHRWLVCTITFIIVGLFTFISLEVYDQSDPLLKIKLTFKGMYAWHTSINFALCLAIVDRLAAWLLPPWGAYEHRTVGKVWLIFSATYLVAFVSQRTLVYQLVVLYSPEILWTYEMAPHMRPGIIPMFLFVLPIWGLIGYGVIRIMLNKQLQAQELFRVRIDTILEERQWQAKLETRTESVPTGENRANEKAHFPLPAEAGIAPIHIKQVGHVTVEDHYLRIHYQIDEDLKSTLIRMPLKELSALLPEKLFVRIHRSHMVNLDQVAGIKRSGRNVRVTMKHGEFELPVSRYRLPKILPKLERHLHPQ